jgi:hypothetical protein
LAFELELGLLLHLLHLHPGRNVSAWRVLVREESESRDDWTDRISFIIQAQLLTGLYILFGEYGKSVRKIQS